MDFNIKYRVEELLDALINLATGKSYVQTEQDSDGDTTYYVRSFDED